MPDVYGTKRMTEEQIIATARDIVSEKLLIADLRRMEWRHSLALLMAGIDDRGGTIGLILVPLAPHAKFHWINGIAPACTFECSCVHVNDLRRLQAAVDTMEAALYPDRLPANNRKETP